MLKNGLEAIVGKKFVLDDEPTLEAHSKDLSLSLPRRPSCIVKPKNTEEVQQVVRLANKHLVPLIPSSSGVHFNGAAIPEQGGIVVDMRRMDKIVQIDALNRKVKIEPGVTWDSCRRPSRSTTRCRFSPSFPTPGCRR